MRTRSGALVACGAAALLAAAAAGRLERHAPSDTEGIRGAQEWFYAQRAFPFSHIPNGALLRATAQARALPRVARSLSTGAAVDWAPIGPQAIHGSTPMAIGSNKYSGPYDIAGRVTSIAPVPGDAQTIYLGTAGGGVWKTTDAGTHWSPVFDAGPVLPVGAVAVDPNAPQTVYAGTGDPYGYFGAGIFKSVDGGAGWSKVGGTTFDDCAVFSILVQPGNSNVVLAAVGVPGGTAVAAGLGPTDCTPREGVYRSGNGGSTWKRVAAGALTAVMADPAQPSTMYLGGYGKPVSKSTDSGAHWTALVGGFPSKAKVGKVALAIAPGDHQRVYALIDDATNDLAAGVWTSPDAGTTWSKITTPSVLCTFGKPPGQCGYDLTVAVDPADPLTFYAGGTSLLRFHQSGGVWSYTDLAPSTTTIHTDMQAMALDAAGHLLIGNDGGIYRTDDGGATFTGLNATLNATQLYPGLAGATGMNLLAGSQDNGSVRATGSAAWTRVGVGDGGGALADPFDANDVYVTGAYLYIQKSVDAGKTLYNYFSASFPVPFVSRLIANPLDSARLFAGGSRLITTFDGGADPNTSWYWFSPTFTDGTHSCCISAIAEGHDLRTLYVGTGFGYLEVSHDGDCRMEGYVCPVDGVTDWANTSTNGLPLRSVTDIAVDPTDPAHAFVAVSGYGSGHVFETSDSGGLWSDISGAPTAGGLPDAPVNALEVDARTTPVTVYAGTDVGLFVSTDDGASWSRFGAGLPNVVVDSLLVDPASNRLLAGTFGRGAWAAPIPVGSGGMPVTVLETGFSPAKPTVAQGGSVLWSIDPAATQPHQIVDSSGLGLYSSGLRSPGGYASHVFAAAGTFAFRDSATGKSGAVRVPTQAGPDTSNPGKYRVQWAQAYPSDGYTYDVQYAYCATTPCTPAYVDQPSWSGSLYAFNVTLSPGTWYFHARVRKTVTGKFSGSSPAATVTVSGAASPGALTPAPGVVGTRTGPRPGGAPDSPGSARSVARSHGDD